MSTPMPEQERLLLTVGGTVAVHVLLLVVLDAGGTYAHRRPHTPAPRIEVFDVEVEPPPPPPPPPPEVAAVQPPPPVKNAPRVRVRTPPPPAASEPPPLVKPEPGPPDPGGAPVVTMKDVAPAARGVAVKVGTRTTDRVGQGGKGTGTGNGDGEGSAEKTPVSVATIKTRAMPKGDYGYFDARKDYPPEARQLGVEGTIRVRLVVDAKGKVVERRLLNKLGHGLDELALARAAKFEFDPARDTDDKAVASVVVWTFTFTLPE